MGWFSRKPKAEADTGLGYVIDDRRIIEILNRQPNQSQPAILRRSSGKDGEAATDRSAPVDTGKCAVPPRF
jgi:hypothetical protein